MIPREIMSKISLEMTVAHYFSYLNEVAPHFRCPQLVKTHYLLLSGLWCVMLLHDFFSQTLLCLSLSGGSEHKLTVFSYCSLASFHPISFLFYLISCSHSIPSGCMNNTCCHACVCMKPSSCLPWCCIEMISGPFFMMLACFLGMWILEQDLYHAPLHPPALPSGYPCPVP